MVVEGNPSGCMSQSVLSLVINFGWEPRGEREGFADVGSLGVAAALRVTLISPTHTQYNNRPVEAKGVHRQQQVNPADKTSCEIAV